MKKKKKNSLLALNYYWHDEKIDSSNDSLCVKKWYFGVQHLNESWVMPLEIFSVQICADEMVLILHKNTSGSARSMSTSSSAILMFCGFCLVKPACLAWGFSCKTSSQPREEVDLAVEAKEGGGLSLNWERTLLEGMASGATEAPMVEGPPHQPADDA